MGELEKDEAGVRIPPPLIFLAFLSIGLWLQSNFFGAPMWHSLTALLGILLVLASLAIILASGLQFRRAKTHLEPWRPTSAIVANGVYAYSRNPIYLGMALGHAGIAIWAESIPALLLLPFAMIAIQRYVIRREESYLTRKFGEEYLAYKRQVRPWL